MEIVDIQVHDGTESYGAFVPIFGHHVTFIMVLTLPQLCNSSPVFFEVRLKENIENCFLLTCFNEL
jgi:hypothetical protein